MRHKTISSESGNWVDVLKVGVPAGIGFALTLSDGLGKVMGAFPWFAVYANTLFAAAMFLVCSLVIISKVQVPRAVFTSAQDDAPAFKWRFSDKERLSAKVALVPLLLTFCYAAWNTMPNGIVGRGMVGGFVCSSSTGEPIRSGEIEIMDRSGNLVSSRNTQVDSSGFFLGRLNWWAVRPASIRITGDECKTIAIPVDAGDPIGEKMGCPAGPPRVLPGARWKVWSVVCEHK